MDTNPISEYWEVRLHAKWDKRHPRFRDSDRLRLEGLLIGVCSRFVKLEERTLEQQELMLTFSIKHEKMVKGLTLSGKEPCIMAEEFKYWGIRYPIV